MTSTLMKRLSNCCLVAAVCIVLSKLPAFRHSFIEVNCIKIMKLLTFTVYP